MYDVAIIGCGVIGAATAYALSRYENKVVILEAENDVADCTTKANSAILHAGYDPAPGTKMARLNVRGVELAKEICAKLDVPYKQCGSLVLALSESELPHLQHLYENGTANGVPDMKILTKEETLAMEPNLSENVCGALWAPSAAIVSPWEYALAMTEVAVRNGVELRRSCRVEDAEAMADGGYRLTTTQGTVEARYVINAAGIWAEKVHCMVEPASFHITPTRGEYYLLDKSEGTRVNHVIFQCPNELGKGVLVSPTVHGNLIVGPDAVPVHGDDTSCTSKGLEFVKATAQRSVPSINFGAATAYALSRYENKVVILEAENDVADCTTKANSAILHAGYDPAPGTKMARLNVRGVELAKEICAKLDVPYKQCGSLVLALSESELPHLQHLYENGTANGVPDMKILTKEETLAMEPNLSENVCGALWAPSAAIVSPWEYALAMTEVAVRNGVELRRSCRVEDAEAMADGGYRLTTTQGTVEARYVINAAGIWAEKVHCMVEPASFHITPTRGEYYLLDKSEGTRVNHVIFQCPNELGKGVLVSPTVHGNLIVGPDAVPVHGDDTSCTSKGLEFVKATAQRSVPSINFGESIRNFAGVRANLDVDDFIIGEEPEAPGWIDLAGMKSPGLSAAPAVAEEAVGILKGHGALGAEKADYKDGRRHIRFKELSAEEKAELVKEQPAYGRVICRCETITEGEILAALHSEVPATTIDGVKRRAGAGMGRCQGGFCGPRVLELISKELGMDPLDILQDKNGSNVLVSETKVGGKSNG